MKLSYAISPIRLIQDSSPFCEASVVVTKALSNRGASRAYCADAYRSEPSEDRNSKTSCPARAPLGYSFCGQAAQPHSFAYKVAFEQTQDTYRPCITVPTSNTLHSLNNGPDIMCKQLSMSQRRRISPRNPTTLYHIRLYTLVPVYDDKSRTFTLSRCAKPSGVESVRMSNKYSKYLAAQQPHQARIMTSKYLHTTQLRICSQRREDPPRGMFSWQHSLDLTRKPRNAIHLACFTYSTSVETGTSRDPATFYA